MILTETNEALELLASYPARSRYSRAFAFDEGFHLLLICKWSEILCSEILNSYFDSMSDVGEIIKEQARSAESRQFIPEEDQAIMEDALIIPTLHHPLHLLFD